MRCVYFNPPLPTIPDYTPTLKEYRRMLDSLAGLKELYENKEKERDIFVKGKCCKGDIMKEDIDFLYDAFESPEAFLWHPATRCLMMIYESPCSTQDHMVIFYAKTDDHGITVAHAPYEITKFARRMARGCVNVTDIRIPSSRSPLIEDPVDRYY